MGVWLATPRGDSMQAARAVVGHQRRWGRASAHGPAPAPPGGGPASPAAWVYAMEDGVCAAGRDHLPRGRPWRAAAPPAGWRRPMVRCTWAGPSGTGRPGQVVHDSAAAPWRLVCSGWRWRPGGVPPAGDIAERRCERPTPVSVSGPVDRCVGGRPGHPRATSTSRCCGTCTKSCCPSLELSRDRQRRDWGRAAR